jgi:hypothetical protein
MVVQEGEHGQVVQPVVFQLRPPERALALETRPGRAGQASRRSSR